MELQPRWVLHRRCFKGHKNYLPQQLPLSQIQIQLFRQSKTMRKLQCSKTSSQSPGTALQLYPWNADLLMANLKGSLKTTESTPHIHYMRNWGSRRKTVIWPWSHGESTAEKNIGVQLTLKVVLFCPKVNLDFLLPNTRVSVTTRQHGSHYFSRMAVWTYVPTSQTP